MIRTRLHPKSLSAPHVKQLLCHTPPPLITTESKENRRRLDVVSKMVMKMIEVEEMEKTKNVIIGQACSGWKKGNEGRVRGRRKKGDKKERKKEIEEGEKEEGEERREEGNKGKEGREGSRGGRRGGKKGERKRGMHEGKKGGMEGRKEGREGLYVHIQTHSYTFVCVLTFHVVNHFITQ